ncbi:DUF1501 domain-containing protein [Tistrella mobilis]|uniref:DUF1501 domain-containing protein n=1 Tax=Tistrella mobilis TaxID=171437 RepID=UPI0035590360
MDVSRRSFLLKSGLALGAAAVVSVGRLPRVHAATSENRLVLVIMRGAADMLGMLPAVGDPDYATMRGDLAFTWEQVLPLNGRFGLTPALDQIHGWYSGGELLLFPAVTSQYRNRSHFDGQAILETGLDDPKKVDSGWLGRLIRARGGEMQSLSVGSGVPTVLRGATGLVSMPPGGMVLPTADVIDRMAQIYEHDPRFAAFGEEIRQSSELVSGIETKSIRELQAFDLAGQMLKKPGGARIAVLSSDGWDTHTRQGTVDGRLFRTARTLSKGLVMLRRKMGEDVWRHTVVLGLSEFGRTVRMNGSGGTDHGTGGFAFMAGGAVNGGRVVGEWPGLAPAALYENRDVAPATDMRAIIHTILADHLAITEAEIRSALSGDGTPRAIPDLVRA